MKTILITGSNTGIGAACAIALAEPGVHLVLACRSEERTLPVLEEVRAKGAEATFLHLELDDLAQATRAARAFAKKNERLDLLVANAGLAGKRGLTKDGFELTWGVNHLGHFAFVLPLLPLVERASGRIVVVASGNHYHAKSGIDFGALDKPTRSITGLPEYAASKLSNVLFTAELRRRTKRLTTVSMNPGSIASDIWRSVPWPFRSWLPFLLRMGSNEVGGARLVHSCNVALEGADAPIYIDKIKPRDPNPLAWDPELAKELWRYSTNAVRRVVPDFRAESESQLEHVHGATA
jgi:retinol dehydrogenase 12